MTGPVTAIPRGVRLLVHVQPRAAHDELAGRHGDAIKVRLQAPPVEAAANEALILLLAKQLQVRGNAVKIVSGHTSRRKTIEVNGVTVAHAKRALGIGDVSRP